MAERIDIRIHVKGNGKVRAYAQRTTVNGTRRQRKKKSTKEVWPPEFAVEGKFVTYPTLSSSIADMLAAIQRARLDDFDHDDLENDDPAE